MLRTLIWPAAVALGLLLYPAGTSAPALAENVDGEVLDRSYGGAQGDQVRRRERPDETGTTGGTSGGGERKKSSSGSGGSGGGGSAEEVITNAVITEVERRILGDYARNHPDAFDHGGGGKGKGKAGKGKKGLPPGIAMNLQRGKPLPPGLRDRHIPADLQSLLPGRKGTRLVPAGEDVLLVDKETEIILDVVRGILHGMGG